MKFSFHHFEATRLSATSVSLPLLSLLCSNTNDTELIILISAGFNFVCSLVALLFYYLLIFVAFQDEFGRGQVQSTLNVWIPPDHGYTVLWDFDIYVCAAQVQSFV